MNKRPQKELFEFTLHSAGTYVKWNVFIYAAAWLLCFTIFSRGTPSPSSSSTVDICMNARAELHMRTMRRAVSLGWRIWLGVQLPGNFAFYSNVCKKIDNIIFALHIRRRLNVCVFCQYKLFIFTCRRAYLIYTQPDRTN